MQRPGDDADLVRAARRGEKAALVTLLERHRAVVTALCRRLLGDAALAEDAFQEAALQAMLNLDHLREPARFGAWLAGIGLNVARRWLRARSRESFSWEALQGGIVTAEPADRGPTLDELIEAADLGERVRRAVAALPEGQRAAVLLFYLAGLTHAETAAQLGIESGAVKTRLHKARRTLRRKLWTLWKETTVSTQTVNPPVDVRVLDIRRLPGEAGKPAQHVVVLEEVGGGRRLPIWIGQTEAEALALQLENAQPPRPMTYAFLASLLGAAGVRLREVRITRLVGDVYYAVAEVDGTQDRASVDARPSDALNLAAMVGAPIRVESDVFAAHAASVAAPTRPVRDYFAEGTLDRHQIAAAITAQWPGPGSTPPSGP